MEQKTEEAKLDCAASVDSIVMYHDGACPLCAVEVAHYREQAPKGRIHFIDASADTQRLTADGVEQKRALKRLHVRLGDGRIVTGAAAFVAIWRQLPGWRRLAPIASFPPILFVLEFGYRIVSPIREVLSGWMIQRQARRP